MALEWEAPGIVLDARPYGEVDALVTVFAEEQGAWRGLARGGASRRQASLWQAGNLVQIHWSARLAEQLGTLSGELVHASAAGVMEDALPLSMLSAACAVAEGALPERESHPRVFAGLLRLIAHISKGAELLPDLVRWEADLLADLGYGIDLSCCAVSGETSGLAYVSPRSGRAVTREAAGEWASKLLKLPGFLVGSNLAEAEDWRDGLALTGHFLVRDAFGHHHRPLPQARAMLADRVAGLVSKNNDTPDLSS